MINRCLHHSVRCKMDYKMLIRYKMENVGILQNRTCISCSNLEYFVILPDPTDSEQNYILKFQEEVWIHSMLHTEQSCMKCHHPTDSEQNYILKFQEVWIACCILLNNLARNVIIWDQLMQFAIYFCWKKIKNVSMN